MGAAAAASISAYISSIKLRYFFAVCGRLSLSLSSVVSMIYVVKQRESTYVGVNSSFSIVNGSAKSLTARTFS